MKYIVQNEFDMFGDAEPAYFDSMEEAASYQEEIIQGLIDECYVDRDESDNIIIQYSRDGGTCSNELDWHKRVQNFSGANWVDEIDGVISRKDLAEFLEEAITITEEEQEEQEEEEEEEEND